MMVDMRQPSKSGIDLLGKTMSVVYMDDLSGRDTVFNAMVAEGFAKALEDDYFGGNEAVNIFKMEKDMAGNYAAKDTLVNAAMMSGDDVVFIFDSPEFSEIEIASENEVKVPFKLNLYAYNTLGADTVRVFQGSTTLTQKIVRAPGESDEDVKENIWQNLSDAGLRTGARSAANFISAWETEARYFYFYDYGEKWLKASNAAMDYRWREAIDTWMSLLDTKNMSKRSAAEYDIALAFYMLGDYDLSAAWLDQSDRDCKLALSKYLRADLEKKK